MTERTTTSSRPQAILPEDIDLIGLDEPDQNSPSSNPEDPQITIFEAPSHQSQDWREQPLSHAGVIKRLSNFKEGPKMGSAYFPGKLKGPRKNETVETIELIVLDSDKGKSRKSIQRAAERAGYEVLVVPTHSHRTKNLRVREDAYSKWLEDNPESGPEDYMLEQEYEPRIAESAQLAQENGNILIERKGGVKYVVIRHAPCPKFRIILFPKRPFIVAEYPSISAASHAYKLSLQSIAKELGITADENAMDLARMFFDPRHPEGEEREALHIPGGPVPIWDPPEERDESDDFSLLPRKGLSGIPFETLRSVVMAIKNDTRFDDRNKFIKILAAIYHETGGSQEGKELALTWAGSRKSGPVDPEEDERIWGSLNNRNTAPATAGTLIMFAKQDGWAPPEDMLVPYGDIWNAKRLALRYRGRLLYVCAENTWYLYDEQKWTSIPSAFVESLAKQVATEIVEEAKSNLSGAPTDIQQHQLKKAEDLHRKHERIKRMCASALSEEGMFVRDISIFDANPMHLGVQNGVLDLRNGKLLPPSPDLYISKLSKAAYNPKATAPTFLNFIKTVLPEPELRAFIQCAVGYSLTGSVVEEKFFFMFGTGANGKSVFSNILYELFGDYATALGTAIIAQNKHENEAERLKAALPGVRAAMVNETGLGDMWDTQRLKEITSTEKLSARKLHREPFNFMPTHKLFIRGNHMPGVKDFGDGFWRRIIPIHFGVQIPARDRDPSLAQRVISEELSGVLNWALEGCLRWQEQGRLILPKAIRQNIRAYREDTDILGLWIHEHCETGDGLKMLTGRAFDSYKGFCEDENIRPCSKALFSRMLADKGFKKSRNTAERGFMGIRLKPPRTNDEEFTEDEEVSLI